MQKWIMMSIHSWETDIEFLSFHLSKEGIVNGPLSLSKLLRWTFKHSLIAIIHHAFSDKTIIVWSPFSFEAITFLVQNSKVEGAKKFFLELWIGNERNVAFIFEKHAQFRLQEFFFMNMYNWYRSWFWAQKFKLLFLFWIFAPKTIARYARGQT